MVILGISLNSLSYAQLVSVDELVRLQSQPNVILIDARPGADYLKTHIKGAINLDAANLSKSVPVEGTLKSTQELAKLLGENGISVEGKIVVYCKSGVNASRLKCVLNYMGCKDVSLLDGNMEAWFGQRKPITKTALKLPAVTFTPAINKDIFVDKAYLKSALHNVVLIDNRKKADYDAGHIGNAVNIDYETLLTGMKLKSKDQLAAIFKNVPKEKDVIVYCKTGTSACLALFALKDLLKYPKVRLYEGAYLDWTH